MTVDMKKTLEQATSALPEPAQAEIARIIDGVVENYAAIERDGLTVGEYVQLNAIAERNASPVPRAEMDAFFAAHGF